MPENDRAAAPHIVTVTAAQAVVEWGSVAFTDIPAFQRSVRLRIETALAQQGTSKIGSLTFSRPSAPGAIVLAPGVTINSAFIPKLPLTLQSIPSGLAAHLRLEGTFDQLPKAWMELTDWVAHSGLQPADLRWEVYGAPSTTVTDLYVALKPPAIDRIGG